MLIPMNQDDTLLAKYQELVALKYQLYNNLFITLPFADLQEAGINLPVFSEYCKKALAKGKSPVEIVETFFHRNLHIDDVAKQQKMLILFLQFVERQVVLFDALEDAAFPFIHDLTGKGTWQQLQQKINLLHKEKELRQILQSYRTRIVLTAHPTQFYPRQVLGIIQDLSNALTINEPNEIRQLLLQLGKTSFKNPHRPTPLDEAENLIQQLEMSFYPALNKMGTPIVDLGFWSGGDRDGNPEVTTEVTQDIAKRLKYRIIKLYRHDAKQLRRHLTFPGIWRRLKKIDLRLKATQQALYNKKSLIAEPYIKCEEFQADLSELHTQLINQHQGLFTDKLQPLINSVKQFGFYFVSIDIRQNAPTHTRVINKLLTLSGHTKVKLNTNSVSKLLLEKTPQFNKAELHKSRITEDTLHSLTAIIKIQQQNGEKGCHRYVISNTQSASNVLEVLLLAKWSGLSLHKLPLDIVPLFESITDLQNAPAIMRELWQNSAYLKHLEQRNKQQTIMLGFSDGTKDGGYAMANWAIFECKKSLDQLANDMGIKIIFFDGRGGPPARGGGNSHKFYQAMECSIEQRQVQLTIQGQTISSKFGTPQSAQFTIEQLMSSALSEKLFPAHTFNATQEDQQVFQLLADESYQYYQQLKDHPLFVRYLEEVTPLNYYGELNIASRPPRRKSSMSFTDLRAIPFVGAWSQMKQNVPGFYGLGSALQLLIKDKQLKRLQSWYKDWLFFRTLIDNAMMSLKKSNFMITCYLRKDKTFGKFWQMLAHEAELTRKLCMKLTQQPEILAEDKITARSIELREEVVLPLLVIQQYALIQLRDPNSNLSKQEKAFLHSLILKSLAANINASRNSA